jgi:ketosteroid isomerase-like protein
MGTSQGSFTLAGQRITSLGNRVTNVYRREAAGWKIVHHHTDISQAMVDIVGGLQGQP